MHEKSGETEIKMTSQKWQITQTLRAKILYHQMMSFIHSQYHQLSHTFQLKGLLSLGLHLQSQRSVYLQVGSTTIKNKAGVKPNIGSKRIERLQCFVNKRL